MKHITLITSSAIRAVSFVSASLTGLLLSGTAAPAQKTCGTLPVIPTNELPHPYRTAPTISSKVRVETLGSQDLSREYGALNERMLRARRITIAPGGSVAWHQHQQRPGVAYLFKGSLIEVRDDGSGPRSIQRKAGDAVFESTGVLHGWRNDSDQPATAVVIDLVPKVPAPL